jgi:hypothetical protein
VVHLEPFTNAVAGLANEMCNDTLSRWIRGRLRVPSGSKPATTKQDTPSSVRASVRNTPECGTEELVVPHQRIGAIPIFRRGCLGLA